MPQVITDEKVLDWRRAEMTRAGFPYDHADALARNGDVDLHAACDLARTAGADYAYALLRP